jgi:FkbM family methyltransferase
MMSTFSQTILDHVRERYHPVHLLRRLPLVRRLVKLCDIPIWGRVHGVSHPVRLYVLRNASYLLGRRSTEPRITALMLAILDTCDIKGFWDIGANIGYYAWLIRSTRPDVRVLAVEPDAMNFRLLEQTRVYAPEVEILNVAVSEREGAATFLIDSVSGATGTLEVATDTYNERHYGESRRSTTVATLTLDSLRTGRTPPDLIKIDVEGHESAVLAGASSVMQSGPVVLIEAFDAHSPALQMLRSAGFELFDAASLTNITPADGNYLAIPRPRLSLLEPLRRAHRQQLTGMGLNPN